MTTNCQQRTILCLKARFISLSLSFSFFRFIRDDKFAYDGRTKFWTKQDFFDFATKQPKNYKSEDFTRGKLVYSKQPRVID